MTRLTAEIRALAIHEGGRRTPFFSGYRPQFYFEGTDYDSTLKSIPYERTIVPGDSACVEITLSEFATAALRSRINTGATFELREGSRAVARGTITNVVEAPA